LPRPLSVMVRLEAKDGSVLAEGTAALASA
jgi:hypothetical protein